MTDRVETLDDLVGYVEVRDVVLYEVSGKRRDGFDISDVPVSEPNTEIRVLQDSNDERIRIRCQLELMTKDGIYSLDAAAIFSLSKPIKVTPELVSEFALRVGIPTVYPYLRVELQMAARRLGLSPPILALFKPNEPGLEMAPMPGRSI